MKKINCFPFALLFILFNFPNLQAVETPNESFKPLEALEPPQNHEQAPLLSEDFLKSTQAKQTLWKVDPSSPFKGWTLQDLKKLAMQARNGPQKPLPFKDITGDRDSLPITFDARQRWYDCSSIFTIRDQGKCGSCWAFGSTSAMSDRICIASKGKNQHLVSARDIMSCCPYCFNQTTGGCEGGENQDAYSWWKETGVVTGGNWQTQLGCQPYPIPINLNHTTEHQSPPACESKCTEEKYGKAYLADKLKAKEVYRFRKNDTRGVMLDLMTHGPVTTSYDIYADFMTYKDGVYVQTSNLKLGGHSVTILGWGTENGVDYWLCKNSWNQIWGHHGFFKIRRGVNEC
eukprot:Sdes_comp10060_c0_seq1m1653